MKCSNITTAKVEHGVDTACWSITTQKISPPAMPFNTGWSCRTTENGGNYPARTGTVRQRLGTTQQAYEKAFAGVVNRISMKGIRSLRSPPVRASIAIKRRPHGGAQPAPAHQRSCPLHVVMDELNDLEMGKILGACDSPSVRACTPPLSR